MDPARLPSMSGSSTLRVGDDLRRYLANAILPDVALPALEMTQQLAPRAGDKPRLGALHILPERHRRLTYIHPYPQEIMAENVRRCKVFLVSPCARSVFLTHILRGFRWGLVHPARLAPAQREGY